MKKYKMFDVVELKDENNAIIKEVLNCRTYIVHIISKDGKNLGLKKINKKEINKILFSKKE